MSDIKFAICVHSIFYFLLAVFLLAGKFFGKGEFKHLGLYPTIACLFYVLSVISYAFTYGISEYIVK